jgi:hypothetical protein
MSFLTLRGKTVTPSHWKMRTHLWRVHSSRLATRLTGGKSAEFPARFRIQGFSNAAPVTGTLAGGRRIVGLAERMPSDHGRQ